MVDHFATIDKNGLLGVPLTSPDQVFTILAQATEGSPEEQQLRAELLRRSGKADSHSAESITYVIRSTRNNLKVQALLIGLRPKTMSVEELARQIADSIQWTDEETD